MKKLLCLLVAFFTVLSLLTGCGAKKNSNKINIVTTVFPCYDFARAIAGEKAEITMLVRPGSESHSFEPTPADMKKTADCDIFILIGGESEYWAERLVNTKEDGGKISLSLKDSVTLLCADNHDDQEEHTHDFDEHIWTSPKNAIKMSRAICDTLCQTDSENREFYEANFKTLENELLNLDNGFKELSQKENKPLVFGDRFPFLYFAKEYGFEYTAAFPGCAEQSEPDINTLKNLIEFIKKDNISTVFYTEFSSQQTADMLISETNAKKQLLHSCHNVTKEEWEKGETYVSLMKNNLESLKKALK